MCEHHGILRGDDMFGVETTAREVFGDENIARLERAAAQADAKAAEAAADEADPEP